MRVCHIVPSLEDRHGGPSKSVRALANAMAARGTSATLLTTHEAGQVMTPADDAAAVHVFSRDFPRRLCRSRGLQHHLREHAYEVVHHHALWLLTLRYAHAAARQHRARFVISPRGMMSGWAHAHNRTRKRLAERLVHPGAFAAANGWHATSAEEADDIRRLGFTRPICVAPNGVTLPDAIELARARDEWTQRAPALAGRRVALFYSRFHRKKRVRELLELWARRPRGDWLLLLVGVPEEYPLAEIQGWITDLRLGGHAAVFDGRGTVAPFAVADLFLLPSHSENFGLVVAEALAAGVPALVTDTTPWRELADREAGWCVPWAAFADQLDAVLSQPPADLHARGQQGRQWTERTFTWSRAAALLEDFYRTLLP